MNNKQFIRAIQDTEHGLASKHTNPLLTHPSTQPRPGIVFAVQRLGDLSPPARGSPLIPLASPPLGSSPGPRRLLLPPGIRVAQRARRGSLGPPEQAASGLRVPATYAPPAPQFWGASSRPSPAPGSYAIALRAALAQPGSTQPDPPEGLGVPGPRRPPPRVPPKPTG